ncbi:hypothetical protein M426DRAFT_50588 [Hypoxylon sp. CI-4A]|nr:hypothetical protein M426DRAFT_50588 [Hypoxylon sp. CI-4A]
MPSRLAGAQDVEKNESSADAAAATVTNGDEGEYPSMWKLVPLSIALCMAMLIVSLDSTILATAIPRITNDFNSLDDVAWYGSSYLFAACALQLVFGKFYAMYPVKWVFLAGIIIFEVGSLVAAVAPSSGVLIGGRTLTGVGASSIFAGAIIILATAVPLRQRPLYTGVLSSMHAVASVAGPLLGGAFTDHVTWRWCFYINLPLGGIAILFLILFLPYKPAAQPVRGLKEQIKQFDLLGAFFLIPSVICLLLALQWGGVQYSWSNGRIIALLVVFGILGIVFFGVEYWQKDRATIPMRLLKNKNILGGSWYCMTIWGCMFVFTYYLPIWFQAIKGVSATDSGLMNLPSILGLVLFSIIAGGLATALATFVPLLLISSAITAVGAGLLTTLEVDSTIGYWFGYQVVLACGVGLGSQNVMLVAQTAVSQGDMAMATSILTFVQTLSSSVWLAVAQNVFQNQLVKNISANAPELDAASIINAGVTAIRESVPPDQLSAVLEAYNNAIIQTFYAAVSLAALSIAGPACMDWISLNPEKKPSKDTVDDSSVDSNTPEKAA